MTNELYADGIGEITVTGMVVRIDLVSLSATQKNGENHPVTELRQRVIMPVDSFANAVDLMQKALNGLVEAGAVRRVDGSVRTSDKVADIPRLHAEKPTAPGPNSSPNFN